MGWRDGLPFLYGVPADAEADLIDDTRPLLGDDAAAIFGDDPGTRPTAATVHAVIERLPPDADTDLIGAWIAVAASHGDPGAMRWHADRLAATPTLTPDVIAAAVAMLRAADDIIDGMAVNADAAVLGARGVVRRVLGLDAPSAATGIAALRAKAAGAQGGGPSMIVLAKPAAAQDAPRGKGDYDPLREYRAVLGVPLPLVRRPDLAAVRARLGAEFPHAAGVIDGVLRDVAAASAGDGAVRLRPTLLVGSPGTGKSRLARRLCEEFGVPASVVPVAGVADAHICGVPKGWSTGHGSVVAEAFRRHRIANPAVLLDELEKCAVSRHNGNVWDALLPLLEPETATAWRDPYVGEINASRVVWICTANTADPIPAPLRSRLRVLRVPDPQPAHVPLLAVSIMRDLAREQGLDPRWLPPLDGEELAALAESLAEHRSVRLLRAQVQRILELREMPNA